MSGVGRGVEGCASLPLEHTTVWGVGFRLSGVGLRVAGCKRRTGEVEGLFGDFEVEVDLVSHHDARDPLLPPHNTRSHTR